MSTIALRSQHAETIHDSPPRERVHHVYRDFSLFLDECKRLPKQKKSGANFPSNLQRMLADEDFSHIITWMPHGRAWKILDKDLLLSIAIPTYFGQTKFASFTRQLSHWGFRRLHRAGPDCGCYYHQCFLRGMPQLTVLMKRVPRRKVTPHAEGEPDFYLISESHPLPPPTSLAVWDSRPSVVASSPIVNVAHEVERRGDTEQEPNPTMLWRKTQADSRAATGEKLVLSPQPSYQLKRGVHPTMPSSWTHGISSCHAGKQANSLAGAQSNISSSTMDQEEGHMDSDSDETNCSLSGDDWLHFLNILMKTL